MEPLARKYPPYACDYSCPHCSLQRSAKSCNWRPRLATFLSYVSPYNHKPELPANPSVWALFYNILSIALGILGVKFLKLPQWFAPAITFNNTTSLPLLLIQSLETTGVLDSILLDGDDVSSAISRAQSYFLVNAVIGNCLTFAIGPRLLDAENAPDKEGKDDEQEDHDQQNGDVEHGQQEQNQEDELTSLLPHRMQNAQNDAGNRVWWFGKDKWDAFSPRAQTILLFCYDFLNAPLIGAVIGAIVGLVPPLHKAFFNDTFQGGVLNAWLTSSLKNVGQLFVTLQVVVVGVSLSSALRKMKRGDASGDLPWLPCILILLIRFVVWPAIAIGVIYGLATKFSVLSSDPVLWFTMMLMPAGPPAMKLIAMADVNDADEMDKMAIAKLLTVSWPRVLT